MNHQDHVIAKAYADALQTTTASLARYGQSEIPSFLGAMYSAQGRPDASGNMRTMVGHIDITPDMVKFEKGPMARANAVARSLRKNPFQKEFPTHAELVKSGAIAKADLDVGLNTNLANVVGGQALGFVSMDTRMARGTIRPGSFTLYQMLKKTRANQVVDYWPSATETGGVLPGAAFNSYPSVQTGSLAVSSGQYDMNFITLKMALDGRAITMALAAQNSFVNVAEQENTNAALSVLSSLDWACYWGNPAIWPNQPQGLYGAIVSGAPARNVIDFQAYALSISSQGLTKQQALFKLIFEQAAEMVGYRIYGIPTHAFMAPGTAGDLQSIPTTILNNIVNGERFSSHNALVINGNLQGMNTRFGDIHFPVDLLITARDTPAQAIVYADGTNASVSTISAPTTVAVAVSGAANAGSDWFGAYVGGGVSGSYMWAVAGTDSLMNESVLTWTSAAVSGAVAGGAYVVTITPASDALTTAFRVYRSGQGSASKIPGSVRHIGDIAVPSGNGTTPILFADLNTTIPGSETIFLLDLDENDDAFDYRYLLPLSKIDLFAQNLFMPWAVACIGSPRVRIPKFHGMITNYVPDKTGFNPLVANNVAL